MRKASHPSPEQGRARTLLHLSLLSILCLLLIPFGSAATLHGTIYTPELQVAHNVLLTINTEPVQRLLITDGTYHFELSQGNYTLKATYLQGGENETTTEQVIITKNGDFTFDLFLFPDLEEENLAKQLEQDLAEQPLVKNPFPWVQLLLLTLLLILGLFGVWKAPRRGAEQTDNPSRADTEVDAGEEILALIRREGGRMTQKELRKRLPLSEAKVSLLVNELVARDKLEKLKRGRGNILVVKWAQ